MKLLINTSTLIGTGVCQVAVSFIQACIKHPENEYIIFLSANVEKALDKLSFPNNFQFYTFQHSLYGLKGFLDILKMKNIEKKEHPDVVFSVFGPSLWRPHAPHLQGYAYPHYVYPDLSFFRFISMKEKIKILLKKTVHIFFLKHNGDFYVTETEDVTQRLSTLFNIKQQNIYTVFNTANDYFISLCKKKLTTTIPNGTFKFYSLCSAYLHKNLHILNLVIPILKKRKLIMNFCFYVTIPDNIYEKLFMEDVKKYIINVGVLQIADCPRFVSMCDALFLPTLLECFSASYPEAMCMGKPILTSNLPFAKTICEDAAIYFDPLDPNEIADKAESIINDKNLYEDMQMRGYDRFKIFGTAANRAEQYLSICKNIC